MFLEKAKVAKEKFYRVGTVRCGSVTSSVVTPNGRRVVTINSDTYNRAKKAASAILKGMKHD